MERERLLHRAIAALLFFCSFIVYFLTIAPTTSFWDCGEFITCAYILGVPHPPGAPFYTLLGRIFTLIPWAADIGLRVNIISAIATALTIMLTYLIIARLIGIWRGKVKTFEDRLILYGSSIIGALAFAFSSSLWFNAVEAEVYAISMFFTAVVVWLILVWHEKADDPGSDKYLFMIAYCIGLAIGVHLLIILAIPALCLIVYSRKYELKFSTFLIYLAVVLIIFVACLKIYIDKNGLIPTLIIPTIAIIVTILLHKKIPAYFNLLLFTIISTVIFIVIYPGIVKWLPNLVLILHRTFGSGLTLIFFITILIAFAASLYLAIHFRSRIVFVVLTSLLLIIIGASSFPSVYFRSKLNPAIDENDPENIENLVKYVNREQYGDWGYVERRAPLWEYQIKKMYLRYFFWQYFGKGTITGADGLIDETISLNGLWGIPFLIGILGMFHHFRKDSRRALAILILFFMTGLAIVLYLNQTDPQPRERDYVYVASFFAFALWIGIGVAGILESIVETIQKNALNQKIVMAVMVGLLFIFIPIKMLAFNFHTENRSGNYVAFDYSYNLLQSCDKDAILFTNGDNDTFPLWFLQYVYKIRSDVRVVNLSLLNTDWYIKQLRDEEPRVPINLSDAEINQLSPIYWPNPKIIKLPVPKEVYEKELEDLEQRKEFASKTLTNPPEISFELGPTYLGKAIRVQDWMILDIIASNQFKKPIYFAITVSKESMLNMDDYLRMDGLVYKLVTYPGEEISPSRLKANLFNKFKYRNLDNPNVYYDDNIIGLLTNYRGGFLRLAYFYHKEKMYDEMSLALDKMQQFIPDAVIPIPDPRISLSIASMYIEADSTEKAEKTLLDLIHQDPEYLSGYYFLLNLYTETKAYEKGKNLAEKLLTINPNDKQANFWLNQFDKLSNTSKDSLSNK